MMVNSGAHAWKLNYNSVSLPIKLSSMPVIEHNHGSLVSDAFQ